MTKQDKDMLEEGLAAVPDTAQKIAKHLRMMADGKNPYYQFFSLPPFIKNIWNAAADIIEANDSDKFH